MSRLPILRGALSASLALAVAGLSLPAFASAPIAVTFAANSVWAQEIGTLDHSTNAVDYTVAVAAGKTLQLNLFCRNANVHFQVKDQTSGKVVQDSLKTGESTWSTPNATATTYTIKVYIEQAAIQTGETAKFALQVGQFGAADMKSPATAVTFDAGKPWVEKDGALVPGATDYNFSVAIAAGDTVKVNLVSQNPQLHFRVSDATQKLVDTGSTGANTWSTPVAAATTYMIQVYVDPAALPSGQKAPFALQIGHYATDGAQPAPAGASTAAAAASPSA